MKNAFLYLWASLSAFADPCGGGGGGDDLPSPVTPCDPNAARAECDAQCFSMYCRANCCNLVKPGDGSCSGMCELSTMGCGCQSTEPDPEDEPPIFQGWFTGTADVVKTVNIALPAGDQHMATCSPFKKSLGSLGPSTPGLTVPDMTITCDSMQNNGSGPGWSPWTKGFHPRIVIEDEEIFFMAHWDFRAVNPANLHLLDLSGSVMTCRYEGLDVVSPARKFEAQITFITPVSIEKI